HSKFSATSGLPGDSARLSHHRSQSLRVRAHLLSFLSRGRILLVILFDSATVAAARGLHPFPGSYRLAASVSAGQAHHDRADLPFRNHAHALRAGRLSGGAHPARGAYFDQILGMGTALMMLTRPQGAYVVPVLFGLGAVLAWRRMLVAFLSAVLVVGVVWAVQVIEKRALAS